MSERWAKRASLKATMLVWMILAVVLLVGTGWAGNGFRAAIDWARRPDNDGVIAAAAALVSTGTTLVLVFLTRRSVGIAAGSLAESQEQRRKSLIPILVFEAYAKVHVGPAWPSTIRGMPETRFETTEYGIRIRNLGPGPALRIVFTSVPAEGIPEERIMLSQVEVPPAMASAGEHHIIVKTKRQGVPTTTLVFDGQGRTWVPIARFRLTYDDIYGQAATASCTVTVSEEDSREVGCHDLTVGLAGERPLPNDVSIQRWLNYRPLVGPP